MIIDEKGKLFGKINIIDLIVLVLIAAAVVVGAYSKLSDKVSIGGGGEGEQTLVIKYYIEEVSDFVAEKVEVGSSLMDDNTLTELGKVTAVEVGPAVSFAGNSEGEYIKTTKDGFNSLLITGEVKGVKTEYGAEVKKSKYGVGHSFVLRAGDAKLYLRVYDIDVLK